MHDYGTLRIFSATLSRSLRFICEEKLLEKMKAKTTLARYREYIYRDSRTKRDILVGEKRSTVDIGKINGQRFYISQIISI